MNETKFLCLPFVKATCIKFKADYAAPIFFSRSARRVRDIGENLQALHCCFFMVFEHPCFSVKRDPSWANQRSLNGGYNKI